MELLQAFTTFLSTTDKDLWFFILLIVMLIGKDYQFTGIILLVSRIIFGEVNMYAFIIIMLLWAFTWYLHPYILFERRYKKKVKELQEQYERYCDENCDRVLDNDTFDDTFK